MAFENIEQLMPDTTETRLAFEEAQRTVADCADAAWRDISSGDVLTASISTVQEAADDAWKACEPTLNAAGETVRDGARNGAYLGGRFVLGAADVGENAYVGVQSNIELLAEDEEAAVKTPGATSWKPMSRYGKSETMSKLEAKSPLKLRLVP